MTAARAFVDAGDDQHALVEVKAALALDPDFLAAQSLRDRIIKKSTLRSSTPIVLPTALQPSVTTPPAGNRSSVSTRPAVPPVLPATSRVAASTVPVVPIPAAAAPAAPSATAAAAVAPLAAAPAVVPSDVIAASAS
ncbi:MAG: hypothetical protein ACJ731_06365, partial [Vicinamibacterales bacterium]